MEFLLLIAIGFALKGAWEHARQNYGASRDQRMKEVAKSYPKGTLPKSRQKAAARQHAAGWWGREASRGFPVTRTGWHAAWLAHQTATDHHKARREEARTTALETRASVLKGMPEHKQRQAEAQKELDAIRGQLARDQAKGSPATGRKAVRRAADEVGRRREAKQQPATCPSGGAPDGYEHLKGCDPSVPPLPADSVRRAEPVVIDTPVRPHNAEDSQWLNPGEPRCEGCGGTGRNDAGNDACPVCRGWGGAAVGPEFMPPAPAGTVCNACGRKGSAADPVLIAPGGTRTHRSHAAELHEAYADALKRQYPDDGEIDDAVTEADSSPIPFDPPTTEGAPVTADTNYTTVLTNAKLAADQAEQDAVAAGQRRQTAQQHAEEMQAVEVDGATLGSQMELVERLQAAEQAAKETGEHAMAVYTGLQQRHGGLKAAHDDAPVRAAQRDFYEGD